jgi:hypothetical protein
VLLVSVALLLLDSDFDAGNAAAAKGADVAGLHVYDAVAGSVDSEVTAGESAFAAALAAADLAYDNLTGLNFLATKQFNAQALTD